MRLPLADVLELMLELVIGQRAPGEDRLRPIVIASQSRRT